MRFHGNSLWVASTPHESPSSSGASSSVSHILVEKDKALVEAMFDARSRSRGRHRALGRDAEAGLGETTT